MIVYNSKQHKTELAQKTDHNYYHKDPTNMGEDILESLWNCLQIIFKHHSKIHKLSQSFKQSSRFCPRKTESTYFWNPTWKDHNFKTTGPIDPKFKPQLVQ